jgi:hypothetical protein
MLHAGSADILSAMSAQREKADADDVRAPGFTVCESGYYTAQTKSETETLSVSLCAPLLKFFTA